MILPKRTVLSAFFVSLLLIVPLSALLGALFSPPSTVWLHVRDTLLPTYVWHTLLVLVFAVGMAGLLGTSLALLFQNVDFKFKRFYRVILVLPLAIPSYVYAMIYADLFSVTGFIGRFLFSLGSGVSISWMNIPGVSGMFALGLYPYVFLITESTLKNHGTLYEKAARSLGASPAKVFFKVTVPLILPGIIAGMSLVAFEVLNDYGTVAYFNIPVFSFAIFDAWFRLGDINTALRIGGYFIVFILVLSVLSERLKRPKSGRTLIPPTALPQAKHPIRVHIALAVVISVALFIPLAQLLYYVTLSTIPTGLLMAFVRTAFISLSVVSIILMIALLLSQPLRQKPHPFIKMAALGYVIPGSIIAVSLMAFTDQMVAVGLSLFNVPFFRYSILMVMGGMVIRFLTLAMNPLSSAYIKLGNQYSLASQSLGQSWLQTLIKVDLPLIKGSLIAGGLLIAIDLIKELPLTLMLRPFGFETLSTMVFRSMQNEELATAAWPALGMIVLSALAIYYLMKERTLDA